MDFLISIGQRLREVREARELSQTELADIAAAAGVPGTTRQSQAKYEKGLQSPSAAYLAALAAHGIDIKYVITGITAEAHERLSLLQHAVEIVGQRDLPVDQSREPVQRLKRLLEAWQRCDDPDQEKVRDLAERLAVPVQLPPPAVPIKRRPKA